MVIVLLSYAVVLAYIIILIYEADETRANFSEVPRHAKWTIYLFFATDAIAIAGGLFEYHFAIWTDMRLWLAGLSLIIAKVALKRWSMKTLGKHYNVHIVVSNRHTLIRTGPYRYVRHPAYLARLLGMVGIPLMLNAFYTLLIVPLLDIVVVFIRISLEERELTKELGEEYKAYKRFTWALLPFKSLLKKAFSG